MSVEHLEVLVEEPSMEAALELLLPKMVGEVTFTLHPHQGKAHLLASLPGKLKAYARWLPDSHRIIVVVDRDNDDCKDLKKQLDKTSLDAGLATKSAPSSGRYRVINRLAIEELEAWFFGDWEAVRAAYPRVSTNVRALKGLRQPDAIAGGTWEAFERVLKRARYFKTGIRKIEAARAVAENMDPRRNSSPSFRAFRDALSELLSDKGGSRASEDAG